MPERLKVATNTEKLTINCRIGNLHSMTQPRRLRYPAIADGAWMTRLDRPFPQIATGDLDIPVVGQLPAANLPFGDEFEPRPVKVVGFDAPFRRWGLWKQDLEYAPGNAHYAFIFADPDAELDSVPVEVPPGEEDRATSEGSGVSSHTGSIAGRRNHG